MKPPKRAKQERDEPLPVVPPIAAPQPEIIEAEKYKRTYFGPDVPTLELDCWEEELSEVQLQAYKNADEEYKSIQNKLDDIVKETKGEIVYNGDQFTAYQLLGKQPVLKELENRSAEILRSRSRSISKEPKEKRKSKRDRSKRAYSESPEPESRHRSKKHKKDKDKSYKENEKEKVKEKEKEKTKDKTLAPSNISSIVSTVRPSEASAIGGLATGATSKNTPIVDLTKDDGSTKNVADSKEVSFNKLQGKTFPSLVVVARPYLRAKETPTPSDRSTLDSKVKSVLMHTPTKFTEWLIQQGLVRSEQLCAVHPGNKLKLGMYSDVSKFPYSGGYVWISECCPTRFVSVFSSSLFEGSTHPPSVLLKLIYHWACQTNVQNVVQWVKVDNLYVKGLFTWLRAACTAALHQHMGLLGGSGRKIEVGVISLGTTSHDGTQRQVKVEVLGVLDPVEKLIRLRAVEPLGEFEKNYKKRFQKILEPLTTWVNTSSTIVTDLTVDKGTLISMGFKTVHQSSSSDPSAKHSNANIMEYLRRIVPRMFQNTLSLLSRQIIQQFLDELVWREKFGITPGQAFDNMVIHLAEQTRYDSKDQIVVRLNKVAANPFKNWKYSKKNKQAVEAPPPPPVEEEKGRGKRGRKPKKPLTPPPTPPPPPKKRGRPPKSYVEEDDDEESVPLALRRTKIKQEKKEKEKPVTNKRKRDKTYLLDDLDDVPLKSIKKEAKIEETVALEKYYFGQFGGDGERIAPAAIAVQCTTCYTEINNNCDLLLHLLRHSGTSGEAATPVEWQCRYCATPFSSEEDLTIHLKHMHPADTKTDQLYTYACLICEVRFAAVITLANHMQKTHAPLELPYSCGRCDYRSSSHRATVDHFYSAHARDTVVQCPHCLMVISVYADGCDLQSNVQFFLQHLLQHQDKENVLRCNRCTLRFVHLGMMKEHQVRCHVSVEGATPICVEEHLVSKPKKKARPPVKDSTNHYMVDNYDNLTLMIPDGLLCKECNCQLEDDKHFLGTCACNKCGYVSGCWRAMLQHTSNCPGNNAHQTRSLQLPHQAHCICSFTTTEGSSMLAHLLMCERKSCYPSEEEAKVNTVQPLVQELMHDQTSEEQEQVQDLQESEAPVEEATQQAQTSQLGDAVAAMSDYPAPPSVLNTQLSLDDLAPPSVMQSDHHHEPELLKNEAYEQPLATPRVSHDELEPTVMHTYMGDFEPLPPPPHQPEFEPL